MPRHEHHIFVVSYNRPALLARTLGALLAQTFQNWHITLVQDGPRERSAENAVERCVETFRRLFPGGEILRADSNLGVALNILRAQEQAFTHLGLEAAYFFEDDLVVHRSYIEQLVILREALSAHRRYVPYFACYGKLHAFSPTSEQLAGTGLRFMDHALWAYGLFRDHWLEEQELLRPYFDYLRTVSYDQRNHEFIERFFQRLGQPHAITSQDGARIVALCLLGKCAVTTLPRRAAYIGEEGEHSTSDQYRNWNFELQPLPEELPLTRPRIPDEAVAAVCKKFPAWVQKVGKLPPYQIALKDRIIARQTRDLERMASDADVLRTQLRDLERIASDADVLRTQLRDLRESTFWRATLPFRRALDKARAARKRLFRKASARLSPCKDTVAIDISTIWHHNAGTGIQRVVHRLAGEMAGNPREGKRVVLVDYSTGVPRDVTKPFLSGDGGATDAHPVTKMEMLIMLDSSYNLAPSFSRRLREAKRDGVFVVSVCHDLLPVTNPEWFLAVNHIPFRRWLDLAVDYSNAFLCVSETTATRFKKHLHSKQRTSSPAVASWPLGHDLDTLAIRASDNDREPEPFALMVGTVEPRKNHAFVLETLARLRAEGAQVPKLVVVGRYGWKNKKAKQLLREAVTAGWAEWHDHGIPDENLSDFYSGARCVVQASLDEGFGLPVAEAAAMGKPVVLSDIPVFREIVQENGYFFRLGDAKSFGDALTSAYHPGAKPTTTKAVSWRESADIFWQRCLELQKATY